jgi:Predicted ATP-dependent endonuclease of the OLD family
MLKEIRIQKYRGFNDVSLKVGKQLTVIAGQNGTQKTTLLGMLTQMFTLDPKSPMGGEKPLSCYPLITIGE